MFSIWFSASSRLGSNSSVGYNHVQALEIQHYTRIASVGLASFNLLLRLHKLGMINCNINYQWNIYTQILCCICQLVHNALTWTPLSQRSIFLFIFRGSLINSSLSTHFKINSSHQFRGIILPVHSTGVFCLFKWKW